MKSHDYLFIPTTNLIDRRLYKYYSNIEYALDCLRNNQIHLDSPKNFNDPFDGAFYVSDFTFLSLKIERKELVNKVIHYLSLVKPNNAIGLFIQELRDYSSKITNDSMETRYVLIEVSRFFQERNESPSGKLPDFDFLIDSINEGYRISGDLYHTEYKMSCFSEVRDSVLMWSYYANKHQGVCIEFDLSKLNENDFNKRIKSTISRVTYSPHRADTLNRNANTFLSSKSDVWSHEHEWRIICKTEKDYLPFDCVSGVILGTNFNTDSSKYRKILGALRHHPNVRLQRCKLSSDTFNMEIVDVTTEHNTPSRNIVSLPSSESA